MTDYPDNEFSVRLGWTNPITHTILFPLCGGVRRHFPSAVRHEPFDTNDNRENPMSSLNRSPVIIKGLGSSL